MTGSVNYHDDPAGYEERLKAKLTPQAIRSTLEFAALYQMTNEMIHDAVVTGVENYYVIGNADGQWITDDARYKADVLDRAKSKFQASLLWLLDMGALTIAQADRLRVVYVHRNELTHELVRFIVDPNAHPDVNLLSEALEILKSIERFWTSVEADMGTFDKFRDLDLDDVMRPTLMILQLCLQAYIDGLPHSSGD